MYHALAREVSTFPAAPEWCTMSWVDTKKTDSDCLVDNIAAYANIRDRVKYQEDARSSKDLNVAESLLLSTLELNTQLSKWLEDFEKTIPGPTFSAVPWGDDIASWEIFSFRFEFTNLKIAMMYLKYWPTFILLNGSMMRIKKHFKGVESSVDIKNTTAAKWRPGFDYNKMTDYAMNVCRTLDYGLEHTMKSSGPVYLTYSILVVYLFFSQAWAAVGYVYEDATQRQVLLT